MARKVSDCKLHIPQIKYGRSSNLWVPQPHGSPTKFGSFLDFPAQFFSVPQFERQGGCAISSLHVPRSVICSAVALLLTQKSLRLGAPLWSMSALVEKPLVGLNSWDLKSSTPE